MNNFGIYENKISILLGDLFQCPEILWEVWDLQGFYLLWESLEGVKYYILPVVFSLYSDVLRGFMVLLQNLFYYGQASIVFTVLFQW